MKILHTADWHIGTRLERFSRLGEQKEVLKEICNIADEEKADAVIIAGDLFDTFNPPTEAVDLFYKILKKLSANGKRAVVAIAGNHDSPDRIEAPDPLARECGIIFAGYPHSSLTPFSLETGLAVTRSENGFLELKLPQTDFPLRLLLTPYANENRLKTCLGFDNDTEEELRILLEQRWRELADQYCDDRGVNLLVAHEKPILHVGGAQVVYTENVPQQIQYTALGHLHRKQIVSEIPCPVYYSGSPLPFSMSEAEQDKYIVILEAEPGKPVKHYPVPLKKGKRLLRGRFESAEAAVTWLEEHQDALVEITLETESFLTAAERKKLNKAHDGIVAIIPVVKSAEVGKNAAKPEIDLNKRMEELFSDYFRNKHGQSPNKELIALFREVIAEEGE
jgi:exonuclease SbcD